MVCSIFAGVSYHKPPAHKCHLTLHWLCPRSKDHNRWTGRPPWSTLSRTARLAFPEQHFWPIRFHLLCWSYLQTLRILRLSPPCNSVSATRCNPFRSTPIGSTKVQSVLPHDILKNGSALRLDRIHIPGTDVNLYYDTSTQQPRPFRPFHILKTQGF